MIQRVIIAIVVGIVTAFVVWLVGYLLTPVTPLGAILQSVSYVAGVIAGIWYYFTGGNRLLHP